MVKMSEVVEEAEGRSVFAEHRRREDPVGSDFLVAARLLGGAARIVRFQKEKRQRCRAPVCSCPRQGAIHRALQRLLAQGVSDESVQAGSQVRHAVDEEQEIDARAPRQRGERDLPRARHDFQQDLVEGVAGG